MTAGSPLAAPSAADPRLDCGNCRAPMLRVSMGGHYGSNVDLDLCQSCNLVWFDDVELARLSGLGMLALIGRMAEAYGLPFEPLRPTLSCPRCASKLALAHNQSRWGPSVQLQCPRRDGAYQSFAQFLEGKGLLRPMSLADRATLLRDKGRIDCVNCGAAVDLEDQRCPYCQSVPSLLDVARLARSLDPEGMLGTAPLPGVQARQEAMQCAACGVALPPGQTMSCAQCGATLAIASLREANAAVQALAPALRAAAAKPPAEVIKRRLDALDADLPRRRDWVAEMQKEADSQASPFRQEPEGLSMPGVSMPVRIVLAALAAWAAWRYGR